VASYSRRLRHFLKQRLARPLFERFQRIGISVTPVHFYSEVPNIHRLRASTCWRRPYDLSAIPARNLEQQLALVQGWVDQANPGRGKRAYEQAINEQGAEGFGPVEARVLYGFVRRERPTRVIQIGCGVSTSIIMQASVDQNVAGAKGVLPTITCVEPYPSRFLRRLGEQGSIDLVTERAQDWDPTRALEELESGDLLFVDSTHTTVPGRVNRIILEWLPSLNQGVWVHFHDIYFPYDFEPGILSRSLFFPRESILLQAFLTCNYRFTVEVSLSLLHHERTEGLSSILGTEYRPRPMEDGLELRSDGHFPSSTYLRVVGQY